MKKNRRMPRRMSVIAERAMYVGAVIVMLVINARLALLVMAVLPLTARVVMSWRRSVSIISWKFFRR